MKTHATQPVGLTWSEQLTSNSPKSLNINEPTALPALGGLVIFDRNNTHLNYVFHSRDDDSAFQTGVESAQVPMKVKE